MSGIDRRTSNQEQWDRPVGRPIVIPDGRKGLPKRSLNFNRCEASLRAVLEQGVGE